MAFGDGKDSLAHRDVWKDLVHQQDAASSGGSRFRDAPFFPNIAEIIPRLAHPSGEDS
jgi:hypothetical protein